MSRIVGSLTIYPDPCWVVGEDDFEQHFRDKTPAQEWADRVNADMDDPEERPWKPRRGSGRCTLITCAHCGYVYDEEGDGTVHLPFDPPDLPAFMADFGWTVDGEAALCSDCSCEALGHDFRLGDRPSRYCWRCSVRISSSEAGA